MREHPNTVTLTGADYRVAGESAPRPGVAPETYRAGESPEEIRQRLAVLANLLDSAVQVPGTNIRIGLDAALGLIPGIGDLASTALASYIVYEARRAGVSKLAIARMSGNVLVDTVIGAVPLVGDLFDIGFRANRRNLKILDAHLEKAATKTRKAG